MIKNQNKAFSLIELSIVILIIGLLVAGIVKGQGLYNKMKIISAASLTNNSVVNSIPNLDAWYETTASKSFNSSDLQDGGQINNWYDINPTMSEKKNLAKYSASYNLPTYKKNCINGLPCVDFNGIDQCLLSNNKINIVGATTGTIFVVGQTREGVVGNTALYIGPTSGSVARRQIVLDFSKDDESGNENAGISGYRFIGSNYIFNKPFNDQDFISTWSWSSPDVSNDNFNLYINGVAQTKHSSTILGGKLNIANHKFTIGASHNRVTGNACTSFFNGSIAEIIIFRKNLRTAQRKSVEKYLSQKYGISVTH